MRLIETGLSGVVVVEPQVFGDERGFFQEIFNAARYEQAGLPAAMVQDNLSRSSRGVLRGLHYQWPSPQGKLVYVLEGEIFDVAVDIRQGSPSVGRWVGETLSATNHRQLYIPEGFAHGFCVLSESALVAYKCTRLYQPQYDAAVAWDDPQLAIDWPLRDPVLSSKDAAAPRLRDIPSGRLPRMGGPPSTAHAA